MSHSKAFGMTNLGYEIRIPQKIYNRATITEKVYYENYWNRLYNRIRRLRVKGSSSYHLWVEYFSKFSFDSEMYTISAAVNIITYLD